MTGPNQSSTDNARVFLPCGVFVGAACALEGIWGVLRSLPAACSHSLCPFNPAKTSTKRHSNPVLILDRPGIPARPGVFLLLGGVPPARRRSHARAAGGGGDGGVCARVREACSRGAIEH